MGARLRATAIRRSIKVFGPHEFNFALPEDLIAQQPSARRDACRLMRLDRSTGAPSHHLFSDLPQLLREGDLLVLNNTRVIPCRFAARRPTGGQIEGLFLRALADGTWNVLLKNAGRCRAGEVLALGDEAHSLVLKSNERAGQWIVEPRPMATAEQLLERIGQMPLPPYIRRPIVTGGAPDSLAAERRDRENYQTVYARVPGAVAAPTAGLHFTPELLERLESRGVQQTQVTLHVGLGTFLPVKAATLAEHTMHSEWYEISPQAVQAVSEARQSGRRVVAVGTTAVRVLESAARRGPLTPHSGWTDIFLYPPAEFALVDALITNFHLPGSTLIMLVSAFCDPGGLEGREMLLSAYAQAVEGRYRFFSYGDAMLVE